MTKRHLAGLFLALLIAFPTGCGPSSQRAGTPTPHGGVLVELPESKGFVELIKQPASGKAGRTILVVYVLDRDKNTISSVPTSSATFTGQATANKPVNLKPKGEGLASEPFNDRGEIEGELAVDVGGSPTKVPILVR